VARLEKAIIENAAAKVECLFIFLDLVVNICLFLYLFTLAFGLFILFTKNDSRKRV
jgi:hypothetical protein